jgi:hypothetical protein
MAQDKTFSIEQPDPQVLQEVLQNAHQQAIQAGAPALQIFSQLQERRAARVNLIATALQKKLGQGHPDTVAMTDFANRLVALKTDLAEQVTRLQNWPTPRPKEWLVCGTVTDEQGKPAAGMTVQVFDRDRKFDNLLGKTSTDASGGFSISYPEKLFKKVGPELPDLYVMVIDAKENTLYTSKDSIRFASGRSEYFAIGLTKKATT